MYSRNLQPVQCGSSPTALAFNAGDRRNLPRPAGERRQMLQVRAELGHLRAVHVPVGANTACPAGFLR